MVFRGKLITMQISKIGLKKILYNVQASEAQSLGESMKTRITFLLKELSIWGDDNSVNFNVS